MKVQFFRVPTFDSARATEELNRFLASHTIVSVQREFVPDGANSFWSVCVCYTIADAGETSRKARIDYREVLSEEDFAVYAKLRELRKTLADRDGVPVFALFNNEQLADMVRQRVSSKQSLQDMPGVGQSRVEKYADAFLEVLRAENKQPDVDEAHEDQT